MSRGDEDLLLLPEPRRAERLGGWVDVGPSPRLKTSIGPTRSASAESYELRVQDQGPGHVLLAAQGPSEAGLRHARATFAQLVKRFGRRLPTLVIEDEPSFAVRGVMLDVSRDRVPTMAQLFETVELLAGLKFNQLQLYTEHTFAYAGHEEAWGGWSPMTGPEIRRLDSFAAERGVALVANQNCFGHLASWLKLPKYAHLAETHGDWMFDVWPRSGAFSLCPTDPASLEFVEGLLDELLPNFTTKLVNIGADETYDVGWGRSKEELSRRGLDGAAGRVALYLEFLGKLSAAATARGYRPMFWADIALSHPEAVGGIPPELIALAWNYEPGASWGEWCRVLKEADAGREVWVCPGTSSWRSIFGRTTERRGNIVEAAQQGTAGGARGFLVCDWGDTGHQQQWPVALHAIAHAAQAAWNADAAGRFDARASSLHALGDASLEAGPWLDEIGNCDESVRAVAMPLSRPGREGRIMNQSALFIDMHKGPGDGTEVGELALWEGARANVAAARAALPRVGGVVGDELRHTVAMAEFAARRAVARRTPGGMAAAEKTELLEQVAALTREHRRLWKIRARLGGLDHSCGFYQQIAARTG